MRHKTNIPKNTHLLPLRAPSLKTITFFCVIGSISVYLVEIFMIMFEIFTIYFLTLLHLSNYYWFSLINKVFLMININFALFLSGFFLFHSQKSLLILSTFLVSFINSFFNNQNANINLHFISTIITDFIDGWTTTHRLQLFLPFAKFALCVLKTTEYTKNVFFVNC